MNAPLTKEQLALLSSDTLTYRQPRVQTAANPGLVARLQAGLAWLRDVSRRHAVMDELSRLSDRELNDIGLVRGDLKQVFARQR